MANYEPLDIIPTLNFGEDWLTAEDVVADILQQHKEGGYTKFITWYPSTGWLSKPYPPLSVFEEGAKVFKKIKEAVAPYGIRLGWWLRSSINFGTSDEFRHMVRFDGTTAPFCNCPLDKNVQQVLAQSIAVFSKIGKPDFIFMEDDFSVAGATHRKGCFCDAHLAEFSKREGKSYTREELAKLVVDKPLENLELTRRWRTLMKDSLVELATAIRTELDKDSPEIAIGHMQPAPSDQEDGNSTEEISRAFAGKNHTPYCRIMSCLYGFPNEKDLPIVMFNSLQKIQQIKSPFRFYHETDTYPHTRFYTSPKLIQSCMGAAYSLGFDGSTFNNAQFLDHQNEERVYDKMFAKEQKRLEKVHQMAKQCEINGVGIDYDPFYNTVDTEIDSRPAWLLALSKFGVPITTTDSSVLFWDLHQAKYKTDAEIKKALSKGLFLDGDAARCLCERGYEKYLGVQVGKHVCENAYFETWDSDADPISFDIGAREVICDKFASQKGKNMTTPFMYSPGGYGNLAKMEITDKKCEAITEFYDFEKNFISTSMTRFENSLGGRVVVMGITLNKNRSHSLINYRRQRLLHEQIAWCGGEIVHPISTADVYTIMNEAKNPKESGFLGFVTLTNLCSDPLDEIRLHLPLKWQNAEFYTIDQNGDFKPVSCEQNEDTLLIKEKLKSFEPMYLVAEHRRK